MRITEIKIEGLFDMFNHTIKLNDEHRLTIVYGANGIGKTMIFKLLDNVFNIIDSYISINKIINTPFSNLSISFSDKTKIIINKNKKTLDIIYVNKLNEEIHNSIPIADYNELYSNAFRHIPLILEDDMFYDHIHDEVISFEEALEKYEHLIPVKDKKKLLVIKPEIKHVFKKNRIYFIQTQRLLSKKDTFEGDHRYGIERTIYEETATIYSQEIANLIKDKTEKYRKLSDDLKNSLSNRILRGDVKTDFSVEELKEIAKEVERNRKKYTAVGLIEDKTENFEIPDDINDLNRAILAVNIQDMREQLKIYEEDNFYERLHLFIEILNDRRFSYKTIKINADKGFLFVNSKGKELKSSDLSSGEQHELILLYQLLFKIPKNSLILIDEPEISLHISWQKEFTKDMEDIIKLRDFDILLATHSPAIINNNWEITQSLNGYEEE